MAQITCVLSAILGNRTSSTRLADAVDRCNGASIRLWFDDATYRRYPAPRWLRRVSSYESEWVARRWLRELDISGAVVVNGFTLAMAGNWSRMIVATDVTPAARWGGQLKSRMVMASLAPRFRRFAARVPAWLPMSRMAAESLVQDFGVSPERCFVTRAPQPIIDPHSRIPTGTILFVGNDFRRKGGFELLEVFKRKLLPAFRLVIVSNDPLLQGAQLPPSVRLICGIRDARDLVATYRDADLLVLPTRFDCYSNVVCEAAAQGVPALATRVGAIGELLDECGGCSLPPRCRTEDIAAGIREALGPGYAARAQAAVRFAQEKLSLAVFDATVRRALELL
jgi:glycosyltransferase involved in cell wall biosynthesis